jgi:hypothetical protein
MHEALGSILAPQTEQSKAKQNKTKQINILRLVMTEQSVTHTGLSEGLGEPGLT